MLKKSLIKTTLFSLSFLSLQACSVLEPYKTPKSQGVVIEQSQVNMLQAGLTKQQVRTILGPTLGKSGFNPSHWEYVFYTTDDKRHQNTIKHLLVEFDDEAYLSDWTIKETRFNLKD